MAKVYYGCGHYGHVKKDFRDSARERGKSVEKSKSHNTMSAAAFLSRDFNKREWHNGSGAS